MLDIWNRMLSLQRAFNFKNYASNEYVLSYYIKQCEFYTMACYLTNGFLFTQNLSLTGHYSDSGLS